MLNPKHLEVIEFYYDDDESTMYDDLSYMVYWDDVSDCFFGLEMRSKEKGDKKETFVNLEKSKYYQGTFDRYSHVSHGMMANG